MPDDAPQSDARTLRQRLFAWLAQPRHGVPVLLAGLWLFFVLEWLWAHNVPSLLRWIVFTAGLAVGVTAIVRTWRTWG